MVTMFLINLKQLLKLTINDTDKETGITKLIEGEWVKIVQKTKSR